MRPGDSRLPFPSDLAKSFRDQHFQGWPLILPNAWDAMSARLFEELGFAAIGTTSAGIAAARGYPDGEVMPFEEMVSVAGRIVQCVEIPVSFDFERGYAQTLSELRDNVRQVLAAGIVGVNLEDSLGHSGCSNPFGLRDLDQQCLRIQAIREVQQRSGTPLFINARTDVYLFEQLGDSSSRLRAAILRGARYLDAGADCVFVPDLEQLTEIDIGILARDLRGPLNILVGANTPPVSRLRDLGVARLSFGPRPMRKIFHSLQAMAREWLQAGTFDRLHAGPTLSYQQVNAWFERGLHVAGRDR